MEEIINSTDQIGKNSNIQDDENLSFVFLKNEIEKLKKDLKESNELHMYARAEIENLRKKNSLEIERSKKLVFEKLLGELFLFTDSLEYGLCFEKMCVIDSVEKKFDFFVGLRLVYSMVLVLFERNGISQLNHMFDEFDPKKHEAIMLKKSSDFQKKSIILDVIQKGYVSGDFVFRHAKVVVSS